MPNYKAGTDRTQIGLYSLEDMVGEKSMARVIDRFVDIVDLQALGFTNTQPSQTGRPAYPPKSLAKLYVYGYENSVRSSRKLERETYRNIEVMWLMDSLKPDHKTISDFRKNNIRPLQKLFREFVKLCKEWDLIGGELFAFDGSKFKASNNKKNNFSRKKVEARLAAIDEKIDNYLAELDAQDKQEKSESTTPPEKVAELQAELEALQSRKEQYDNYKKQLDETGENELSTVDPDAKLMGNNRGGVDVAYNIQSAADAKHSIVVDYDVSTNPSDQHQLGNMVKKVKRSLKIKRFTALADKGYYNGKDLMRVKRQKVVALVARQNPPDSKTLTKAYRTENFHYDESTNTYICPQGHTLTTRNNKTAKRWNYSNKQACKDCPYQHECITGKAKFRTVTRSPYSKIYEQTDKRFSENKELYKRRQEIVEHPFGTIKYTMNGGYFLLRTRRKVRAEVALLFLGYNLKRAVSALGFDVIMAKLDAFSCKFRSFFIFFLNRMQLVLCGVTNRCFILKSS